MGGGTRNNKRQGKNKRVRKMRKWEEERGDRGRRRKWKGERGGRKSKKERKVEEARGDSGREKRRQWEEDREQGRCLKGGQWTERAGGRYRHSFLTSLACPAAD